MIKKLIPLFTLLGGLFLFSYSSSSVVSPSYTEVYNLDFRQPADSATRYRWMENAACFGYHSMLYDLHSYSRKNIIPARRLLNDFEQRILLPVHDEKKGTVTLKSRGENLECVTLLIDGLDGKEQRRFSDTVSYTPDTAFSSVSKEISLAGVELLNIRIHVEGKDGELSYITLSRLGIKIGEKDIDEYPLRELPTFSCDAVEGILPLQSGGEGESAITAEVLGGKNIVALGEPIHGSSAVRRLACQLMMGQVRERQCRLLLWEMPMENSFWYHRYVCDQQFVPDAGKMATLDEQQRAFLNELRQYNKGREPDEMVHLWGMDYVSERNPMVSSAKELAGFLTYLNRTFKLREVDTLVSLLAEKEWQPAIDYLKGHQQELQAALTADEQACMLHILSLSQQAGSDRMQRKAGRDSVMFANADFLLSHYTRPSAVVYAHSVHINPVSSYPVVSGSTFGKYMKEKYGDDYATFLLLTDSRRAKAFSAAAVAVSDITLQIPPTGSMEALLGGQPYRQFYLPLTEQYDGLILSRFTGSVEPMQEFYPFNLYRRYQGIFFVKD